MQNKISIKQAADFHGHLGPYLILGIIAGELALKKLGCKKFFGLEVKVRGANKKPKSCLVDGLQLSTGATYGKGNIEKISGSSIRIVIRNLKNNKKVKIEFKKWLSEVLNDLSGHKDSEMFAKKLYRTDPGKIFMVQESILLRSTGKTLSHTTAKIA